MKKAMNLLLTAMMLTALFCLPATAAESSPHHLIGTVIFGTNYVYRGVSETANEATAQAELDYEHDSGFYAGIWGGNIAGDSVWYDIDLDEEFTETGNVELDFYVGYWRELGPIELDLTATYLHFPNNADAGGGGEWDKNSAEADYFEFHIGLAHRFNLPTVPKLSVGYDFSPDYFGEDGVSHHVNALLELGLPLEFVLALEAGYMEVEGDNQTGEDDFGDTWGLDGDEGYDYQYYRIGLSRDIFGVNCDVSYHFGNSEDDWFEEYYGGEDVAKDQVVFTLTYAF